MRAVVQRVLDATVDSSVDGRWERVGAIGRGMCVLVGVTHADTVAAAHRLADKLVGLRLFDDAAGVMNVDLGTAVSAPPVEVAPGAAPAGFLVVSQFTLYGDTRRGRRPSWVDAAAPDVAEPLVEAVVERLRAAAEPFGLVVATGRFRTEMRVALVNDGPVTVVIET